MHNYEKYHRRSIRLKDYDYSQEGAYFVTICTYQQELLFGTIRGDKVYPNAYGLIVVDEWEQTAIIRKNVKLDDFVVMPNHFHGIILVSSRGVLQYAPTNTTLRSPSQTVGAIVRGFKSAVTKRIKIILGTRDIFIWQRNYYEHVIRNEDELNRIRLYIRNNPMQWQFDRENPHAVIGVDKSKRQDDTEPIIYGSSKK